MKASIQKYLLYNSKLTLRLSKAQGKYLCNSSFLSRAIVFRESFAEEPFDCSIFIIEGEDVVSSKFASNVTYSIWFYLKHFKTGKYIGLSSSVREQATDTIYDLELKEDISERSLFRLSECYIYQSKISSYIKPGEELYLVAKLKNEKEVFMSCSASDSKAIATYNSKLSVVVDFYSMGDSQQAYNFSDHVLVVHSETQTYLCQAHDGDGLEFEELASGKDYDVRGVWIIEAESHTQGGTVLFQQRVRLRNLYSKQYLAFSLKARVVENFKIYPVIVQREPTENTLFRTISIIKKDGPLKTGSYMVLQNAATLGYLSNTITFTSPEEGERKRYEPSCISQPHPRDVYRFEVVQDAKVWAINSLIAMKTQLRTVIDKVSKAKKQQLFRLMPVFLELMSSFQLILKYLKATKEESLEEFSYLQWLFKPAVDLFISFLDILWMSLRSGEFNGNEQNQLLKIVELETYILARLVERNLQNKDTLYRHVLTILDYVCLSVGAEQLLVELFTDHLNLIVRLDRPLTRANGEASPPILEVYLGKLKQVCQRNPRNKQLFAHVIKFIKVCAVFLVCDSEPIGYNQTYVTGVLFQQQNYRQFMFGCKVSNDRVRIDLFKEEKDIEDISESAEEFDLLIEQLNLFSLLCSNRNMIAKNELSKIFSCGTLINYIQMPISEQLKRIIFKLITNIYVDSNPRTPRVLPHSVLVFSTDTFEHTEPIAQEDSQMSARLNDRLIQQNGETMRVRLHNQKLNLSNVLQDDSQDMVMEHEELQLYYMILEERIEQKLFSSEMFESIHTLIRLECLQPKQIHKLFVLLLETLDTQVEKVGDWVFELLQLVCLLLDELYLGRLITMGKFIYFSGRDIKGEVERQRKYVLPGELSIPMLAVQLPPDKLQHAGYLADDYNEFGLLLDLPNKFKGKILDYFLKQNDIQRQKLLLKLVKRWFLPKQHLLRLFEPCILLTRQQDIELANYLFSLFKRMYRLNESSEIWLALQSGQHRQHLKQFCYLVNDLVSFLYESHQAYSSKEMKSEEWQDDVKSQQYRTLKSPNVSGKRQQLLKNIGLHNIVLQFLKENFFMLQNVQDTQQLICRPFFYCFDFLHGFILKNNTENKRLLQEHVQLLFKYLNYVDLGQSLVIAELYHNNLVLCKRLDQRLVTTVIDKITLKGTPNKRISDGVFSPTLAQFLVQICIVEEKPDLQNLQIVMKVISNASVLRNLLFLDQIKKGSGSSNNQYIFNLDVKNVLSGMVPYIYHSLVLKVINSMFDNMKLGVKALQKGFLSTIDFNYLLQLIVKPDHYTCVGTEAKLTFILKLQVCQLFRNVFVHSEKDMLSLKNNETLGQFLSELSVQIDKWRQGTQDPVPDRSMAFVLEIFVPYLSAFDEQFKMTYPEYLSSCIIPILKHFEGQLQKHKEFDNYRSLIALENKIMSLQGLKPLQLTQTLEAKAKILQENPNYIHNLVQFPLQSICSAGSQEQHEDHIELFTKSYYAELMLNATIRSEILKEEEQFYDMSSEGKESVSLKEFVNVLIGFADNLADNCGEDTAGHEQNIQLLSDICNMLCCVFHYNKGSRNDIVTCFLKGKFLKTMMELVSQSDFNLRHLSERQLMFDISGVINHMFGDTYNADIVRELASIFTNDRRSSKILTVLKDIIVSSSVNKKSGLVENINEVLRGVTMSYQGEILQQAPVFVVLELMGNFANNSEVCPFTEYFRRQKSSRSSIDFLPMLVNAAMSQILDKRGSEYYLNITFAKYPLIAQLIKTVQTLMYGPCEENQVFLMETKFPTLLLEVMKTDSHPSDTAERDNSGKDEAVIIGCVESVLKKASPQLATYFSMQLKKGECTHDLLVNLVKHSLLKCIEQMINGNDTTLKRLTLFLPEEYLKVNLLWVYNQFVEESKIGFRKDLLNEIRPNFQAVVEGKEKKRLVLENGFIIYKLIKMYNDARSGDENGFNVENDQEKKSTQEKKLALIRKFFELLRGQAEAGEENESVETQLEGNYIKEIKMYKQTYKQAVKFFEGNSVSVQVSFQDKLYRVFFPKLPMCNYFDSSYQEKFKKDANRISQISKLHCLMQAATNTIDQLELEESWQNRISEIHPFVNYFFNFNLIMAVALLVGVFSTVLFIIVMDHPIFTFPFHNTNVQPFEDVMFRVGTGLCAVVACLVLFTVFVKKIPVGLLQARRRINDIPYAERTFLKKASIYGSSVITGMTFYMIFVAVVCSCTIANPLFSCFLLIDIFRILDMARNILVAIGMTWRQLLAGILIFVMMNYIFAFLLYLLYSAAYAPACQNLYICFLLLNDTYFKAGAGFFGSVAKDYTNAALGLDFLVDLAYIIFICTVIKQIFSGTIIDKFSELREHRDAIREDQAMKCYVCGLERYELDFELQGFKKHNEETHNMFNYIFYIFYLLKKDQRSFSRLEKFVFACVQKNNDRWFPVETSIYKINREKRLNEQHEERADNKFDEQAYNQRQARKKLIKEIKTISDTLLVDLKHTS